MRVSNSYLVGPNQTQPQQIRKSNFGNSNRPDIGARLTPRRGILRKQSARIVRMPVRADHVPSLSPGRAAGCPLSTWCGVYRNDWPIVVYFPPQGCVT